MKIAVPSLLTGVDAMALNFLKSLEADDIFISYSREDGTAYLTGLDAALSKRGFSCFTDKRGTDAGRLPPATLYRKVRLCKTFVLLATPGALSEPENIAPEVTEFANANGTSRIICVSFDADKEFGDWASTPWYSHVEGKAREREHPNTLKTGEPSEKVVEQIVAASDYMKSKDRLRKYRNRALAGFLCLFAAGLAASGFALYSFRQATLAKNQANAARKDADIQIAKAQADIDTARKQAQSDIEQAQRNAQEKIAAADALAKTADEKRMAAEEQRQAAEKLRDAANREAHLQSTIAYSRSLANHSQRQLRQRPEEVQKSLKSAVDSMKVGLSVGLHPVEADTALRESLALLPRQLSRYAYVKGEATGNVTTTTLSPDGRFFASIVSDKLFLYNVDSKSSPKQYDCQCTKVALNNGGTLAAVLTTANAIRIFDLRSTQRSVVPAQNEIPEYIALSPNGRYLALVSQMGESDGQHSKISVLDLTHGTVVKTFDNYIDTPGDISEAAEKSTTADSSKRDTLNMLVHDVSFGPTGNLAIAGKYNSQQGGLFAGRVVIWNLNLFSASDEERDLTDADFNDMEIVQEKDEVMAVTPGADATQFATDKGIWKRFSGQIDFEPAGRLPYDVSPPLAAWIQKLAFDPSGRKLTLVRSIEGDQNSEILLETWDANGHRELASSFQTEPIYHLGFSRDARFLMASLSHPRVFTTNTAQETEVLSFEPEPETGTISPVGDYFIHSDEKVVVIWNVWNKKKTIVKLDGALKEVEEATISPGGKFFALAGINDRGGRSIVVYGAQGDTYESWKVIAQDKLREHKSDNVEDQKMTELSLSADGRRLAVVYSYGGSFVRVWNVAAARDVSPKCLKLNSKGQSLWVINDVNHAMISPDGKSLLITSNDRAALIDLSQGSSGGLKDLVDDTQITALTFSPDGRYIAVGSVEGILHVFETIRPDDEIALLQHTGEVTAVVFSDDGKYVATASSNPHPHDLGEEESYPIRVSLLQPQDLLKEATARLDSLNHP
jgi:WD40 repeat protein